SVPVGPPFLGATRHSGPGELLPAGAVRQDVLVSHSKSRSWKGLSIPKTGKTTERFLPISIPPVLGKEREIRERRPKRKDEYSGNHDFNGKKEFSVFSFQFSVFSVEN